MQRLFRAALLTLALGGLVRPACAQGPIEEIHGPVPTWGPAVEEEGPRVVPLTLQEWGFVPFYRWRDKAGFLAFTHFVCDPTDVTVRKRLPLPPTPLIPSPVGDWIVPTPP